MSGNEPLVSVIIPAYNHENYIQDTIRSVINQTYKNIELLIIDDGSKDSTWQKICEMKDECEERFPRIEFRTHENSGVCATNSKLYDLTQGEYIYTIASDDMIKPQAIEKEIKFLEDNPDYALCVGDNEIIDSKGCVCYWDKQRNIVYDKRDAKYITFSDFLKRHQHFKFTSDKFGSYDTLYIGNYIPNGYLVRKSIYSKLASASHHEILEDWFFMLQIAKYAKMKYIDEVLFSYRWHDTNTIKQSDKMYSYLVNTSIEELKVLENADRDDVLPSARRLVDYIKKLKKFYNNEYGYCYKILGIPFIFELFEYKKMGQKTQITKLFGKTVRVKIKY